jgi:hypothetical protein
MTSACMYKFYGKRDINSDFFVYTKIKLLLHIILGSSFHTEKGYQKFTFEQMKTRYVGSICLLIAIFMVYLTTLSVTNSVEL